MITGHACIMIIPRVDFVGETPSKRSSDGTVERSSDRPRDRAIERSRDRASDRANRSTERPSDRATERSTERPSDRAIERPSDRATERPMIERRNDRASVRAIERSTVIVSRASEVHLTRWLVRCASFFKTSLSITLSMRVYCQNWVRETNTSFVLLFKNFEIKFWCFRWTLLRGSTWGCRSRFEWFVL